MQLQKPSYQKRLFPNFRWPAGKRCAVAIGWHVDGESGPIAGDPRNAHHLAALSEGAYGVSTALPRLLDLHHELAIPASFFIPGYVAELHPEAVVQVARAGHEVAHHGYLHENVFLLDEAEERDVFERGSQILEGLTGARPVGWSAPGWGLRLSTVERLIEMGMLYDSSLMEYDTPYLLETPRGSLVELPISLILDDWEIFGGSLFPNGGGVNAPVEHAYQIWRDEFDGLRFYGGLFTTTFHPNILGRPSRIRMLHRLFSYMKSFDDVWLATYAEIAAYVRAQAEEIA